MASKFLWFCLLGNVFQIRTVLACNRGGGENNPGQGVIQKLVGKDVSATPYDGSGFNGGTVTKGSDLNCDFSAACCWKDGSTGSVNWQTANGTPENAKLKKNFGTTTAPNPPWLVAASEKSSSDDARFVSCPVPCTTGNVQITLKRWVSPNAKIQVCLSPDGGATLQNCQALSGGSPGPSTATFNQITSPTNIVIDATTFTQSSGSVAMIDDIVGNFDVCQTTTSTTTAATTTTAAMATTPVVCTSVKCNFESGDSCSYKDLSSSGAGGANKQWTVVSGNFQNPASGVRGAGEGQKYAAVYLFPGDSAAMQSDVNFNQDFVVRFLAYKATEGINFQACCDSIDNCRYSTGKAVQVSDFNRWKTVSMMCPKGTKKVVFYASNDRQNKNQGAVGLDNIQVFASSGGSADSASQQVC